MSISAAGRTAPSRCTCNSIFGVGVVADNGDSGMPAPCASKAMCSKNAVLESRCLRREPGSSGPAHLVSSGRFDDNAAVFGFVGGLTVLKQWQPWRADALVARWSESVLVPGANPSP